MDEDEFNFNRIRELLAIQERAIVCLISSGAPEETIREVRHRRNCYAQFLNMADGPLTRKRANKSCFF